MTSTDAIDLDQIDVELLEMVRLVDLAHYRATRDELDELYVDYGGSE